jgi:hypothetical protein
VWHVCHVHGFHPYILVIVHKLTESDKINIVFIQKNPTRCNSVSKFIISYLYEAQHVSGDTPPIIRSLKLHKQPLVLHNIV